MFDTDLNKKWRIDFFNIFSSEENDKQEYEKADKIKFEHFPPVIAKFYTKDDMIDLEDICQGKVQLKKAKLSKSYNDEILKINYKDAIKAQLNVLMQQQIDKLKQEDPDFLGIDEKQIIESAEFPFIKLMTLVYSKDTDEMTEEDKNKWKYYVNEFINQQIIFGVINTYFTMKLYQDNIYTTTFQTPYNKEYVWDKYADNREGICITYDFKEISELTASRLAKIYPVVYSARKMSADDFDHDIYNTHCASLIKIDSNVTDEDNAWEYLTSYHYDEKEYKILDRVLEPIYDRTFNYEKIQKISKNNYLYVNEGQLEYDYEKIISDLEKVLNSSQYINTISESLNEVYDLTDNTLEINFMKPEGIYLGTNFTEEKIGEYKQIAQDNNVKIFLIKQGKGILYKSLI